MIELSKLSHSGGNDENESSSQPQPQTFLTDNDGESNNKNISSSLSSICVSLSSSSFKFKSRRRVLKTAVVIGACLASVAYFVSSMKNKVSSNNTSTTTTSTVSTVSTASIEEPISSSTTSTSTTSHHIDPETFQPLAFHQSGFGGAFHFNQHIYDAKDRFRKVLASSSETEN